MTSKSSASGRLVGFIILIVLAFAIAPTVATHAQEVSEGRQVNRLPASAGHRSARLQSAPRKPWVWGAAGSLAPDVGADFELPVTYGVGGVNPFGIAVGDLNGDHHPDLVAVSWFESQSSNEGSISVLLGNGDGTFKPEVSYGTGGQQALAVTIADVNGDHKPDLIVADGCMSLSSCGTGGVSVLLGNGDGTFKPAVVYATGGCSASSVAVADINGDGHPDLIVSNYCSPGGTNPGVVGVLLGNGDGTFQPVLSYPTLGSGNDQAVAVGDLNGDGHPDVVVVGQDYGTDGFVTVMLGNGDGTFQPQITYDSGALEPYEVTISDLNGDGHPDVVVTQLCQLIGGVCNDAVATVLLGNGDGTLGIPVSYDSGVITGDVTVAVADLNGDGHLDLAVAGNSTSGSNVPGAVGVLSGNGDGTFQPATVFPTGGSFALSIGAADLNGDGKVDLAVLNGSGVIGILLNNTGAAATTTVLATAPNPSGFGQAVTLTATVSAASGTPTGPLIFYDGASVLGTANLSKGAATINISSFGAGQHSLVAVFQGSSNFAYSSSSVVTQTVNVSSTSTALSSSANPIGVGQNVTYTATVTSQYGGPATRTVAFSDGGKAIATVTLSGNQAAYTTFYLTEGTHKISAVYSGDANNDGSASAVLSETAGNGAPYSSHTSVVTSGSPTFVGQSVTFTASVSSTAGPIPDGESVTFYYGPPNGLVKIGSGTTAGGVAALTTTFDAWGAYKITANYVGDSNFKSSVGKTKQMVEQYTTTVTLSSSENPSYHGDPVTFTVSVTSSGPHVPTGQVRIFKVGTVTLVNGLASAQMPDWGAGKYHINATYYGDTFNKSSKAPVLVQVVLRSD
jgi:hypothetical protein